MGFGGADCFLDAPRYANSLPVWLYPPKRSPMPTFRMQVRSAYLNQPPAPKGAKNILEILQTVVRMISHQIHT